MLIQIPGSLYLNANRPNFISTGSFEKCPECKNVQYHTNAEFMCAGYLGKVRMKKWNSWIDGLGITMRMQETY